ncbi:hypothetical protein OHA25_45195 [Nonomuraea sp. NBC_00507]|uniref:hypothetical protein n=1 Tax=Nonomuraea sp. NBC_00507 TaxID=2976002 RepID=UPI002E18ECD3
MTPKQDLADAPSTDEPPTAPAPDDASTTTDVALPNAAASTETDAGVPDAASTADDATEQAPDGTSEQPTTSGAQPAAPGTPPNDEDGRGRRAGRVTRARIVGALAAMLVAAVAATAVLQWVAAAQADDARTKLEAERALRLEVSGAASAFSKALLSYDYRDLQTTRATLTAQATGDFLTTYDTAFGGAMAQVIVKLKAVSQATVREVYLADVDEATAHAIVVVDQQVNTSEAIRSVKDSHLKIALVKDKGTWKVHDVTVLGAASEDQYTLDGGDQKKKD